MALTETVENLHKDLKHIIEWNSNKKRNHSRNLTSISSKDKKAERNQCPQLGLLAQIPYSISESEDNQTRIDKRV